MGSEDTRVVRAVGDYFRRARETMGWTLSDVVERASKEGARFSVANLSRFERGLAEFSLMDAYAIARALGTPLNYLEEVIRAAKSRQDVDVTGSTVDELMTSGKQMLRLGELGRAVALFEAAHDRMLLEPEFAGCENTLADILINTANGHRRLRHFALASDFAGRALAIRGISADKQASALIELVAVFYMTRNCARARVYAMKVRDLRNELSPRTWAAANASFGATELKDEQWAEAIKYFEVASEEFTTSDDVANLLVCRANLGYCLSKEGRHSDGVQILKFVVAQAAERDMRGIASLALRYLGRALTDVGDYDHAREALESAASISRALGSNDDLFIAWFLIWRIEQKAGRTERSKTVQQTLSRLLRKADPHLPEVEEFTAISTLQSKKRGASR